MPKLRAHSQKTHAMWSESNYRPTQSGPLDHLRSVLDGPARSHILRELMHLKDLGLDPADPDLMDKAIALGLSKYVHEHAGDAPILPTHDPIVYYMRMRDLVKIGTTTNIATRFTAVCPEGVLGVELGGVSVERVRHEQFAELRHHGEWFAFDGRLKAHIADANRAFGEATGVPVEVWLASRLPQRRTRGGAPT